MLCSTSGTRQVCCMPILMEICWRSIGMYYEKLIKQNALVKIQSEYGEKATPLLEKYKTDVCNKIRNTLVAKYRTHGKFYRFSKGYRFRNNFENNTAKNGKVD